MCIQNWYLQYAIIIEGWKQLKYIYLDEMDACFKWIKNISAFNSDR